MIRLRNILPVVATALFAATILGAPSRAKADFAIRYSTDGGGSFSAAIFDNSAGDLDPLAGSIQVNIGGVNITSSANSFVSQPITNLDLGLNGAGVSGPVNIVVQASLNGINTAPPPQTLAYDFTGHAPTGFVKMAETWVNNGTDLFITSGAGIVADTGNLNIPSSGQVVYSADPLYSITAQISLSGNRTLQYGFGLDNNNDLTPAPVPGTLLMVLLGGPVLGVGAWVRRRKLQTA
jgi:hypothetical protein